ncbi:MAG: hypothetical protein SFU98_10900 [Leptospiraceae bacterium]|nr:hypothetical protein [Leptospiraceae bacterium]
MKFNYNSKIVKSLLTSHFSLLPLLVIVANLLITSNCLPFTPDEETKRIEKANQQWLTILYTNIFTPKTYSYEQSITDNKDGTLTFVNIEYEKQFGVRESNRKTVLFQRCLIGQVYRKSENDCRGTGTKETVWGALKFQWCPTNDRSCEDNSGNASPSVSPAANACAESIFLGKKWEMHDDEYYFSSQNLSAEYSNILYARFNNLTQDYYTSDINEYESWQKTSAGTTSLVSELAFSEKFLRTSTKKKNLYSYSLCKEKL